MSRQPSKNAAPCPWARRYIPSSEKPLPKPLMNVTKYKIPPGTKVRVKLINGESYTGVVLANPSASNCPNVIELIECLNVTFGTGIKESDTMTLQDNEISDLYEIQRPSVRKYPKTELTMRTVVVDDRARLDAFIGMCGSEIREVGLKFLGSGRGRYARSVAWILTSTKGVLMPFDVLELEKKDIDVFEALKIPLFKNKNVIKVFHNSRPEADYLFHRHTIELKNVYDTQLLDVLLDKKTQSIDGEKPRGKMLPLYAAIGKYLPHIAMERELAMLKLYSSNDNLIADKDNPLMARPIVDETLLKYMALSVKFLLHLKDEVEKKKNYKFRKLHEEYIRSTIDLEMGAIRPSLYNEEELPLELPEIIDYIFQTPAAATGKQMQPDNLAEDSAAGPAIKSVSTKGSATSLRKQ